jgi:hypothetical protein
LLKGKFGIVAFLLPLTFYILTLNGVWSSDYQESILGLQYSIWTNHSLSLGVSGNPLVHSVDVGLFNGRYFSEISPGFALLSLPFAGLGFLLDGGSELNLFGNALILDELFLALTSALATFVVYKISRFYAPKVPSLLSSLALSLGTSVWPMSTMIFVHGTSLFFSTSAVYLVLKCTGELAMEEEQGMRSANLERRRKDLLLSLAGLSLGLATFVEYVAALFVIPLLVFLFLESRLAKHANNGLTRKKIEKDLSTNTTIGLRSLFCFLSTFTLGPALQLGYNYVAFGNPLIFPEDLKNYGTSLASKFSLSPVIEHMVSYLMSPYRGVLFFSPILVLGVYGLYMMANDRKLRATSYLFVSLFLIVLVTYSSWTDWAGGLAYGPRFLILGLPYLGIPIAVVLSQRRSTTMRAGFLYLFVISSLIQGVGALTTALSSSGRTSLFYQPLALNFPWFMQGKLDTWWLARIGADASTAELFGFALLQCAWIVAGYFVFKEYAEEGISESPQNHEMKHNERDNHKSNNNKDIATLRALSLQFLAIKLDFGRLSCANTMHPEN